MGGKSNNCPVCRKTTNAVASNKAGALQCSICELWFHPPCVQVDDNQLDLIKKCVDMGMGSPWSCTVCRSALEKLDKSVKQVAARVSSVEVRTENLEKTADELKMENVNLKEELVNIKNKLEAVEKKTCENSSDRILEEVAERSSKERNVVLHNCMESNALNLEEAQRDDLVGVQTLFNELGLREVAAKEVLVGWRRLGQKKNDSSRPLLLIFKARSDRDRLLDRAPRLSRHQDEEFRKISIVSDLTQKQRKLEQDMFKRAEKLNLERSSEMISKNLCHKVLGRRGERVLRQVELRENETVSDSGRVVNKEEMRSQDTEQRKRALSRSPGSSPPARRGFGGRK